jgi:hypothetical protein
MMIKPQAADIDLETPGVYLGKSNTGLGIFAVRHAREGEVLLHLNGDAISLEESIALGEDECYSVQVEANGYIQPGSPARFINHSCEPNCGLTGDLFLVAITDIDKDEELFFDYSTTMLERRWEMDCGCGTSSCRGRIRDFDTLPPHLQQHYRSLGIVQPFILEQIDRNVKP